MSQRQQALRKSLGRSLRRLRLEGELSLDDVERSTTGTGVRVTRSHLSRVETGQADIALSRFLSLMRALGLPAAHAARQLAPLLEDDGIGGAESQRTLDRALCDGRHDVAVRLLRAAHARNPQGLSRERLAAWGRAEAALGRWNAAGRAFRLALSPRPTGNEAARLAVTHLGARLVGLAELLASGSKRTAAADLVLACCALARGEGRAAIHIVEEAAASPGWNPRIAAVADALKTEGFRRSRQPRAAGRMAHRAMEQDQRRGCAVVELWRASARAMGEIRRPQAGLRWLRRARAEARRTRRPALLAACYHDEAALWRSAGELREAGTAERRAKVLLRRCIADGATDHTLPLAGLLEILEGGSPSPGI